MQFFDHFYVTTATLSDGEVKISLHGRLLGGVTYEEALENLRQHIDSVANPSLLKDLLEKLSTIARDPINIEELNFVSDLSLPDETKTCLIAFGEAIKAKALSCAPAANLFTRLFVWARGSQDQSLMNTFIETLKTDLSQLAQREPAREPLWKELETLFSLTAIKALSNFNMHRIKRFVKQDDLESLREFVREQVGEEIDFIERQVPPEYGNLNGLLGEVIEQKPKKQKEGFFALHKRGSQAFMHKTLCLNDPTGLHSLSGTVSDCRITEHGTLLSIDDGTEIIIAFHEGVRIIKTRKEKLFSALTKLPLETQFKIVSRDDRSLSLSIQPGCYKITKRQKMPGKEITEISLEGDKNYTIRAHDNPDRTRVARLDIIEQDFELTGCIDDLNGSYLASTREETFLREIQKSNLEQCIFLREEDNENKIKHQYLKKIQGLIGELRAYLMLKSNREILQNLIDNLIKNKLIEINLEEVPFSEPRLKPELLARLCDICEKYKTQLELEVKVEILLKQVVEEANYALLVDKEQSVLVSRTMELLKDAHAHRHLIQGNDVILMIGNTGSGKSTAAAYLMGAPMQEFTNPVGDKVYRIKEEGEALQKYPKIGQALGDSETLYTTGYRLNDKLVLGDCPGFDDTRGGDYELCTNLSIDEAIRSARSIKSIVITLPVQAFMLDRGNPVIDVINTVQERFPQTFNPDRPEDNRAVFLLVTKQGQVQSSAVSALKDGRRLEMLFEEALEKAKSLFAQKKASQISDEFELQNLQRRMSVWRSLKQMHEEERIHFIDLLNPPARKRLLDQYGHPVIQVNKSLYVSAMQGPHMQLKFGQCVEMAAHTWSRLIFEKYLYEVPQAITISGEKIKEKIARLDYLEQELVRRREKIKQIEAHFEKIDASIKQLNSAERNHQQLTGSLKQHLEEMAENQLQHIESDLQDLRSQIESENERLRNIKLAVQTLEQQKIEAQGEVASLTEEIDNLEKGETVDVLYEQKYSPDKPIHMWDWKPGARERCFAECRDSTVDDRISGSERTVLAKDYKGKLASVVKINRAYRLVPADQSLREQFENMHTAGGYTATVEGENYTLDLGVKSEVRGTNVVYGFLMHFDQRGLPKIKISHCIPNQSYYESTIANHQADIKKYRNRMIEISRDLDGTFFERGKEKEQKEITMRLTALQQEKTDKEISMEQQKKELTLSELRSLISKQRKARGESLREKVQLEDSQGIEKEKTILKGERKVEEDRVSEFQRTQRNLALIIKTQWETVQLLRSFAKIMEEQKDPVRRSQVTDECKQFSQVYDKKKRDLEQTCAHILGLS